MEKQQPPPYSPQGYPQYPNQDGSAPYPPYPTHQHSPYPEVPPQNKYGSPPAPGFYPPPQQQQPITSTVSHVTVTSTTGSPRCPACGSTAPFEEYFTGWGWCLCCCFFPLGIIPCFLLQGKKCSQCGFNLS